MRTECAVCVALFSFGCKTEVASSVIAAEEIGRQAQIAVLRAEYNESMRQEPKYILFLEALCNSANETTVMVAIEAVHNLLWPLQESNTNYSVSADRMKTCGNFLLVDKVS